MVQCKVFVLDGSQHTFDIPKSGKVQDLFNAVCQKLQIVEKDYFGLSYEDKKTGKFWLDNSKKLAKYMTNKMEFSFEVKLYPPEPFSIENEMTRYQLFLQLRRDILSEKLPCSFMTMALLGSYAVQSELGDYEPSKNGQGFQYLKDLSFATKQTTELLEKIHELHITHRGFAASEAEGEYMNNAKKLSLYGVHMHDAKDQDDEDVQIGVCAAGLLIFKNRLRIHRFVWPKIIKILYKRNIFTILIRPAEHEKTESTLNFKLPSYKLAKRLWKLAVEHHAFFRLKYADPNRNTFARFGNSYRFSSRSQQISKGNADTSNAPGNLRQGGKFRSMEGIAGYSTERIEEYQEDRGQRGATLTLKGRRQGSLPFLDREDDQSYDGSSYDRKNRTEQWQKNQNFDGYGTVSSAGRNMDHDNYSRHTDGSVDNYETGRGYNRPTNNFVDNYETGRGYNRSTNASVDNYETGRGYSRPPNANQRYGGGGGGEGDDLPPYQDDRLMQQRNGLNVGDGHWDSQSDVSQIKTSTRTYVGPDGSIVTEHRRERTGVIETNIQKVRREKRAPDVDYDKALSEAILAVTNMSTDLAVEKIEIQTKEERERQYYSQDDDDDDLELANPGETII